MSRAAPPSRGLALLASAAACGLLACARKEAPPPPSVAAELPGAAVDRLLPGELAEGRERALGLAVPRDMHVERRFDDSVVLRGRVSADALANYVSKRIDTTKVEIGATRRSFPRAHVKGQPDDKSVRIEVVQDDDTTMLVVRDVTPPPVTPGLSDEERWRKAGVTPGKGVTPGAL